MDVVPAVDLLGEQAVRLLRGDYDSVVATEDDPAALVARFVAAGAARVHVVDLDGARGGGVRPGLVARLVEAAGGAAVQAAGGVRAVADAELLLAAGADRVVVGTAALAGPGELRRYAEALGDALVVALDVRAGRLAVAGWTREVPLGAAEAVEACAAAGVARVMCTAVDRDGTLAGPDLDLFRAVAGRGLPVIAAGGVAGPDDLAALAATGCEAAVVGRALLTGAVPPAVLAGPVAAPGGAR